MRRGFAMIGNIRSLCLASAAFALTPSGAAWAFDGVVASIKPVHSLVAAVMDGVGEPALVVSGTGSEHIYSMRPSDAQALENASVVFWVGDGMETFLKGPIETLAGDARVVALEDAPGLIRLDYREGGPFEAHSHDHDDDEDDHAHEDGHDHHDDDDGEDDHAHGDGHGHHHDDDDDHAHGRYDLHFWLDPVNAKALVAEIERTLSEADPANAERYRRNAADYSQRLDALVEEIVEQLAPVRDRPAVVFHDAYQYFEQRFGVNVAGSITVSPEIIPGAQRIAEIKAKISELDAACVFSEPQFEPRLVSVVTEGTDAKTGVLDPLGAELEDGPELYVQLIRSLSTSLSTCLAEAS